MSMKQFIQSLFLRAAPLRSFDDDDLTEHPHDLFAQWFSEAQDSGLYLPEAMTLSTVNDHGQPSSRTVLLKGHRREGFEFFTNVHSRKAQDLKQNRQCALLFHWNILHRQIRIEGEATPVPEERADEYFSTRPRESQIGAWASDQSQPLGSRQELDDQTRAVEEKFKNQTIPRPEYWSGYRVAPRSYEFWQGRAGRLHDRFIYRLNQAEWQKTRLSP